MNVLGIDFGTKQIGLAIWMHSLDSITPLTTIKNTKHAVSQLFEIIKAYDVHILVVGWPNLEDLQQKIKDFIDQLRQITKDKYELKIFYVPESYSTYNVVVDARMSGKTWKGVKKLKRTGIIDSLSAVNILERAKDSNIL